MNQVLALQQLEEKKNNEGPGPIWETLTPVAIIHNRYRGDTTNIKQFKKER
ncbi:class III lanthipeptide [Chengkuizengella sp. SCS-71B]|uniref:class III lanthipeptide n=1 Tax=Chengkuizengella sp. SCS-71B TaxID=3115290 RepID=UPI0032C218EC